MYYGALTRGTADTYRPIHRVIHKHSDYLKQVQVVSKSGALIMSGTSEVVFLVLLGTYFTNPNLI